MYSLNLNKTEALKTQEHEAYNEIATRLQRDHGSLKISAAYIERHHTSPRAPFPPENRVKITPLYYSSESPHRL
jgi:hypothetical protein